MLVAGAVRAAVARIPRMECLIVEPAPEMVDRAATQVQAAMAVEVETAELSF